jgi:hypothetical protein
MSISIRPVAAHPIDDPQSVPREAPDSPTGRPGQTELTAVTEPVSRSELLLSIDQQADIRPQKRYITSGHDV